MKEKDLETSINQFEGLWDRVDKTRSTSKSCNVNKAALMAILMDHSMMVDKIIPNNLMKLRSS